MRGRPRYNQMVVRISIKISLREGEDDDLIDAFRRVPPRKRASFVKAAMRSGGLAVPIDDLPDDEELAESLENFLR